MLTLLKVLVRNLPSALKPSLLDEVLKMRISAVSLKRLNILNLGALLADTLSFPSFLSFPPSSLYPFFSLPSYLPTFVKI